LILLTAISLLHRFLLKSLMIFFIAITSFSLFFKSNYNIIISEDIIVSAWINDLSLSQEMISLNLIGWLMLTGLLPSLYIAFTPIKIHTIGRQILPALLITLLSSAMIALIFLTQGFNIRKEGQIRDSEIAKSLSYFSPIDSLYSTRNAYRSYKKYLAQYSSIKQLSQHYHYQQADDVKNMTVIVVVGETARGDHFSLNGYQRLTNPLLSTLNNVYSFSNVSSCNTITIRSMKCIFSRVNATSRHTAINESSFTEILRSLGFRVDILSLQNMHDIYNYLGYTHITSKYSVLRSSNIGAKDAALLPFIKKSIQKDGKQLIVLHTLGSHQAYHDRVLKKHQQFLPFCTNPDVKACDKNALINAYDNSIIATDEFLYDVIQSVSHEKSIVLYISDHGESLGENGNFYHGMPIEKAPKEQFNIPFLIWLSPNLLATDSGKAMQSSLQTIDKATPLSHDNFFHSVLGCAGIYSHNGGIDNTLSLCTINPSPKASLIQDK